MKECHRVIACAVREGGPARGKRGEERCTRQLLCPRALPRNVSQRREQLPGLRRPEGQGWHQRAHILYTLVHTFKSTHTHILVPMWACSPSFHSLLFFVMLDLEFVQPL